MNKSEKVLRRRCPVTREQFVKHARPLVMRINDLDRVLPVKQFATGSFGWYANGPLVVDIDDVPCKAQFTVTVVLVGSKQDTGMPFDVK